MNQCRCGCGGWTQREFCPGHDARHRGNLLRTARLSSMFSVYGDRPGSNLYNEQDAYDELQVRGWLPSQHGTGRIARRTTSTARRTTTRRTVPGVGDDRRFGVEMEIIPARNVTTQGLIDAVTREFGARGLEITYAGYTHTVMTKWKIVTDSSVYTQYASGIEIVSPPMSGLDQLKLACEALEAAGAKVNVSCGLHVHHEVADYEIPNFRRLVEIYDSARPLIDGFMPASRRTNWSGRQWARSYDEYEMAQVRHATSVREMCYDRYKAVNLTAYAKYGTVEFRQHSGTTEYTKISSWVRFGQAMIEMAKTEAATDLTDVTSLCQSLGLSAEISNYYTSRTAAMTGASND